MKKIYNFCFGDGQARWRYPSKAFSHGEGGSTECSHGSRHKSRGRGGACSSRNIGCRRTLLLNVGATTMFSKKTCGLAMWSSEVVTVTNCTFVHRRNNDIYLAVGVDVLDDPFLSIMILKGSLSEGAFCFFESCKKERRRMCILFPLQPRVVGTSTPTIDKDRRRMHRDTPFYTLLIHRKRSPFSHKRRLL